MTTSIDFKKFRRPKVTVEEDLILISDPPIGMLMAFALLCLSFVLELLLEGKGDNTWGIIVCSSIAVVCLYNTLTVNRVRVDLRRKAVFRTTLNPIGNLLDRILQHPSVIPFDKITRFGVNSYLSTRIDVPRHHLYVEYDGLYKLTIGIFKRAEEANSFAEFLRTKIKAVS